MTPCRRSRIITMRKAFAHFNLTLSVVVVVGMMALGPSTTTAWTSSSSSPSLPRRLPRSPHITTSTSSSVLVTSQAATRDASTNPLVIDDDNDETDVARAPSLSTRRAFFKTTTVLLLADATRPPAAHAAKGPPPMSVDETVAAVRFELNDPAGSVGRLQAALDAKDFPLLMETTKTMDQSLRKKVVGQAKYYWPKDDSSSSGAVSGTQLSNNITFDLIGINRNARPGQESAAGVQQYLDDLKSDLEQILRKSEQAAAAAAASS